MIREKIQPDRNYLFDNLKAILIILVVLVHMLAPVSKSIGTNIFVNSFLTIACSFHMPLFVFISGYFSGNTIRAREKSGKILLIFCIGQLLLVITQYLVRGTPVTIKDLLIPQFSMWYLLALFLWRYFLDSLVKIRYILPITLILNVLIMCSNLQTWVIRSISFCCFFLMGYYTAKMQLLDKIRKIPKWISLLLFLLGVSTIEIILISKKMPVDILRGMMLRTKTFDDVSEVWLYGFIAFVYVLILEIIMSGALLSLCSDKKLPFTYLGSNSLTIYLGQAIVYIVFNKKILSLPIFTESAGLAYLVAIILSVLCILICGNSKIAQGFTSIINKLCKIIRIT